MTDSSALDPKYFVVENDTRIAKVKFIFYSLQNKL